MPAATKPAGRWEPTLGTVKGGAPGKEARDRAAQLLEGDELINPEDIDDPEVRAAYTDGLLEEEFGEKPSYRKNAKIGGPGSAGAHPGSSPKAPVPGRSGPAGGQRGGSPTFARPAGSAGSSLPHPTLTPSMSDGTGFALGLVLYALGLNYIRYGPPGVRGWLAAKFLNKPNPNLVPGK